MDSSKQQQTKILISQEIETLSNELETLRLPHKLKQYRSYEKQIERLREKIQQIQDDSCSSSINQKIDQLCTKLDKSVICGVDRCFLCSSGTVTSFSSYSSSFHYGSINRQQDSIVNIKNGGCNNVSMRKHQPPSLNDQSFPFSLPVSNAGKHPVTNSNNNDLEKKKKNNVNHDINDSDNGNYETHLVLTDKPASVAVVPNGYEDDNKNINHENQQQPSQNNGASSDKPQENVKNHNENAKCTKQESEKTASINEKGEKETNHLKLTHLTMSPRPYHKVSTTMTTIRPPPIVSSYKAYKDFINNYAKGSTSITAINSKN